MKFLVIDYQKGSFCGNSYFFAGFQNGFVKGGIDHTDEHRFYFNGLTEHDCLNKAYEYCKLWDVGSSRTKFKLLLDSIKLIIQNEKKIT